MKTRTVALIALTGLALAGCGLRGELERPAPMWGDPQVDPANPAAEAPPDPNAPVPISGPD